jgi:hypothetical protein
MIGLVYGRKVDTCHDFVTLWMQSHTSVAKTLRHVTPSVIWIEVCVETEGGSS